jgi:ketosteroid isomerase-like protein
VHGPLFLHGEHWLEASVTTEGKDAFRESTREWLSVWESIEMKGLLSGVEGRIPMHMVMTVRDGKINRLEWYPDHDRAVAAARGA